MKQREEVPETKDGYHYTRYVMNTKDINVTPSDEEIGASGTITNKYALKYEQHYKINEASGGQVGPTALKGSLERARKYEKTFVRISY